MSYPSRHVVVTLASGLLVLLSSGPAWAKKDFKSAMGEGWKLIESKEYEKALTCIDEARASARSENERVTVLLHEGTVLAALGRRHLQNAEKAFRGGLRDASQPVQLPAEVSDAVQQVFEAAQRKAGRVSLSSRASHSPEPSAPVDATDEQENLGTVLEQLQQSIERKQYVEALSQLSEARSRVLHEEQRRTVSLYEGVILASLGEQQQAQANTAFYEALLINPKAQLPASKVLPSEQQRDFGALRKKVEKELAQRAARPREEKAQWSPVKNMAKARERHTATLLPSGKVLVAGGVNSEGALSEAELYDPVKGTWTPTDSMSAPRYRHTATLLASGKVLVTGGENDDYGVLPSAELYDPATGTWSPASSMNVGRHHHTATLLASGKVLAAGGKDASGEGTSMAELYDPVTGLWTGTGSLATHRIHHTAILLSSGKVLVTGGADEGSALSSSELYDPATGTWSALPEELTTGVYDHQVSLLPSGKVLVMGGYDGEISLTQVAIYDSVAGTWNGVTGTDDMGVSRTDHTSTVLLSGKVLVVGGEGTDAPIAGKAEVYDPTSGTWLPTASMSLDRIDHTATLLPSGKVLVAGGSSDDDTALSSAEVYNP